MKTAYVFPGQGAQVTGMGKSLYDNNTKAKDLFLQANDILGFDIAKIMFEGTAEDLKQTNVTQPAVFLHSVIAYLCINNAKPLMTAGHSLGEFSALVANGSLSFEDGLKLVNMRANAMQKACDLEPSTMAVVLGLDDKIIEDICNNIKDEIVVPANYNSPGQLVISGSINGITMACEKLKEAGAKRAMILQVGGAFHSPLMAPAQQELQNAIESTVFNNGHCPIYQNINAKPVLEAQQIKTNLIKQLTGAVLWTQCVENMIADGANHFIEVGPGNVLQGLIKKINKEAITEGVTE
jgi:[acyl-carrier-protein] S-malonyltransferase